MKEEKGDLFSYIGKVDALCITTNGFVKSNGNAVMGRGCALQAATRWSVITKLLGKHIRAAGNVPHKLIQKDITWIYSFPVKPINAIFTGNNAVTHMIPKFKLGQCIPGWACIADERIIEESARYMTEEANSCEYKCIVLPRPGCGAGELSWDIVKPILNKYLDGRFISVTYKR